MSTPPPPLDPFQQLQPPPMVMAQEQANTVRSGHGSVGPVIGVLAVIALLTAVAVMIGRLCSGRGIMGRGHYDFESWVETKCSSCIDGRVEAPLPRRVVEHMSSSSGSGDAPPLSVTEEAPHEETKDEEAPHQPNTVHERVQP